MEELPQDRRVYFIVGGTLLSAFSGQLYEGLQTLGLWSGVALIAVGLWKSRRDAGGYWKSAIEFVMRRGESPRGGLLGDPTLQATGVVHGGKLRLEVARSEDQRFVDLRHLVTNEVEVGLLVSLVNGDYKETVDDVVVKILSYKRMTPNPLVIPVSCEIEPASRDARRRALNPLERREYVLGVLEERLNDPAVRLFWLGGKSAGESIEFGTYEVRIGFSGRNISQKVETLELRFTESSVGLSGVRQHAD